jgi:hypothetical protein
MILSWMFVFVLYSHLVPSPHRRPTKTSLLRRHLPTLHTAPAALVLLIPSHPVNLPAGKVDFLLERVFSFSFLEPVILYTYTLLFLCMYRNPAPNDPKVTEKFSKAGVDEAWSQRK